MHEGIHCQKAVNWSDDQMQHRFVSLTIKIKDKPQSWNIPAHMFVWIAASLCTVTPGLMLKDICS